MLFKDKKKGKFLDYGTIKSNSKHCNRLDYSWI